MYLCAICVLMAVLAGGVIVKIKAILFDMDGVLIDAREWHYEALNKALNVLGLNINRYDHLNMFDGLPTKRKLEMLSVERGLPRKLHNFLNDLKQEFTFEEVVQRCRPNFIHQYALSRLKNDGYKMAVCSNSVRNSVSLMVGRAALDGYLEFFLSNEDVSKAKPDPEIYNKAIEKMGFAKEEVLILEDNVNGIRAATDSGAHVMRIASVDDVNYHNIKPFIDELEGKV